VEKKFKNKYLPKIIQTIILFVASLFSCHEKADGGVIFTNHYFNKNEQERTK